MTSPKRIFGPAQSTCEKSAQCPDGKPRPVKEGVMAEHISGREAPGQKGNIPYIPDLTVDSWQSLDTQVESDNWTTRRMKDISRIGMDRFDNMGEFVDKMMVEVFENVTRCSVYFAPTNLFSDTMSTDLEHRMTVTRANNTVLIDESGHASNRGAFDPVMVAFMNGTPTIIDRSPGGDLEHGVKIVYGDLDRNSDKGIVHKAPKEENGTMTAIMPFYYKEPDRPSGVIVLEGDLRARNSRLEGFSKPYWAAHLAMSAAAQISLQLIHRFDAITNLPRRLDFELDLKEGIKNVIRKSNELHMMFIDLDNFKRVNDVYTHPVGDEILRQAAEKMQTSVRSGDAVFRVGGEEFGVIVPDISYDKALEIAERIRRNIESISVWVSRDSEGKVQILKRSRDEVVVLPENAEEVKITCSIGVTDVKAAVGDNVGTVLPPNGKGETLVQEIFSEVYSRSARLLHVAKNSGKNRIYYTEEGGSAAKEYRMSYS